MAWVEMIKVRAAGNKEADADDTLPETIEKIGAAPGLTNIKYFVHGNVPGDRMIILIWETPRPPILGSELSHGLIQELKRYGPVDYSVWVEKGV
jgi:hypothetical protein